MLTKLNNPTAVMEFDQKVEMVESEMLKMPQVECPVEHHFGPGLYIREVRLPAGSAVIGHHHKTEHLNTLVQGRLLIINPDGSRTVLSAPYTFVAKPGRKVVYTLEDVVFHNIFATDETNIDILEDTYMAKSNSFLLNESMQKSLMDIEAEAHRVDFIHALAEVGLNERLARHISENEHDQIDMPGPVHPYRIMESPIEGKGYFLTVSARAGSILAPARIHDKRTPAGRYVNHSSTPNAKMSHAENGNIYLVATKDIKGCMGGGTGDEVTIDYRQVIKLIKSVAHKAGELCQE